jgi:hypothetical protein
MFLSRSDEEINVNRKLAKELVDKWVSRRKLVFGIIFCVPYYYQKLLILEDIILLLSYVFVIFFVISEPTYI